MIYFYNNSRKCKVLPVVVRDPDVEFLSLVIYLCTRIRSQQDSVIVGFSVEVVTCSRTLIGKANKLMVSLGLHP